MASFTAKRLSRSRNLCFQISRFEEALMARSRPHALRLVAVLLVAGTVIVQDKSASEGPAANRAAPPAAPAWSTFVDQFHEDYFAANPTTAVGAGRHEFDGELERGHIALGIDVLEGASVLEPVPLEVDLDEVEFHIGLVEGDVVGDLAGSRSSSRSAFAGAEVRTQPTLIAGTFASSRRGIFV